MRAGIASSTCFLAWLCDSAVAMVEAVYRKLCGSEVSVCYRLEVEVERGRTVILGSRAVVVSHGSRSNSPSWRLSVAPAKFRTAVGYAKTPR